MPESQARLCRVLVCGSRDWVDEDAIADTLAELVGLPNVEIIHGGARGADRMAATIAETYGFAVRPPFLPDYELYSRWWAPKQRNLDMLDEQPNLVIAFQRNESGGTQHVIDEARRRGIPVDVRSA